MSETSEPLNKNNRQVDIKALVSHLVKGDGLDKCRICLGDTSQGQVHLGDTVMMDGDKPVTLSELLELITGVEMEWTPWLPERLCQACTISIHDFTPFLTLCRQSVQKWTQIADYLNTLSVDKKTTTAYVLIGDVPQTLLDRSATKDRTPKAVLKNIRTRLRYIRYMHKKGERAIEAEKTQQEIGGQNNHVPTTFSCPDCRRKYTRVTEFNKHLRMIGMHCCEYCFSTLDVKDFGQHLKESHDQCSFTCKVCHLHFDEERSLIRHRSVHNRGEYVCPECKHSFSSMLRLTMHTSQVHSRIKCVCGDVFKGNTCYSSHKKTCRKIRSRKYICDYCSRAFNYKFALGNHITYMHANAGTFTPQCDRCGKLFRSKEHLIEHSNTHEKVLDRYSCDYCDKKFSSSRGYRKHLTKMHYKDNPELKKRYPCPVCSKPLVSETNMRNHITRQHKDYELI